MKSIIQQIKESIQIKNITDIFTYSQLKNTETYHSNYFILFIIEFILFGCLSLYLYKLSKNFNEKIEFSSLFAPRGIKEKHELLLYLTKATFFRFLSFIYIIVFSNKTALDLISFINFIMHIFPSFLFLMSFYLYIGFLMEKFYELSLRKIYILTSLKYILYFSILLIILLSLAAIFFKIYKESYFFIESVICLNYFIIGFLYLIYGRKITTFIRESNTIRANNPYAIKNIIRLINSRIIPACFIISLSYIILGVIIGLTAIDFYGIFYPNFIDLNLFDSMVFFISELLPSFIIGFTKKKWNNFIIEELNNQQGMGDFEVKLFQRKGSDVEIMDGNKTLENQMEEMLERFEDEKNS